MRCRSMGPDDKCNRTIFLWPSKKHERKKKKKNQFKRYRERVAIRGVSFCRPIRQWQKTECENGPQHGIVKIMRFRSHKSCFSELIQAITSYTHIYEYLIHPIGESK